MTLLRMFLSILILSAALTAAGRKVATDATDSLMHALHTAIENRDTYQRHKEDRLIELRNGLHAAKTDRHRFDALDALLNEYHAYNTDSAFAVCRRREELARKIGDPRLMRTAALNTANILAATGMYKEASDIMDTIPAHSIPDYVRPFRFHILRTLYGLMADYALRDNDRRLYTALTEQYLDSLMTVNEPGTIGYVMAEATSHNYRNEYQQAIEAVQQFLDGNETTTHEKAICAYTLAESYELIGDTARQKDELIKASIADMQSAVREYVSLRKLAMLLYDEGNVAEAYELLRISLDDAAKCNARLRVVELNNIFPLVNEVYLDTIRQQRTTMRNSALGIGALSLALMFAVFYVLRQMRRTAAARKDVELANNRLQQLNSELNASNADLCEANRAIAENSHIKEEYIARYMDQCSLYIEKIDSFRKQVGKLIAAGKTAQLNDTLRSTTFLDEELKAFYHNFDTTFLNLFPTFVADFNALLRPEEEIIPKKSGQLTTELRIFALIRLGINDSVKIAQFLRYSVTTIYNYRTKARNKALGDRDKLEEEVMRIGRENSRTLS